MATLQGSVYPAQLNSAEDLTGSTVTVTVTAPDGTVSTPTVTPSGTTSATADIPATQAGDWLIVWSITGALTGVIQDQFHVKAAALNLLSLPDLKTELNIRSTDTTWDTQLTGWLDTAATVVQNVTGPILPTPRTDVFDGGGEFVILRARWVKSITTVLENIGTINWTLTEQPLGQSVDAFGYTWDRATNRIVRRTWGGSPASFTPGRDIVQVTYLAGMASIPQAIQQATARMIEHWQRKTDNPFRASGSFSGQPGDDAGVTMVGHYEIPNAAMELLEPFRRRPGIF